MSVPKSRSEISDTNSRSRRKGLYTENPVGLRLVEALQNRDLKWLSAESGIPDSTLSGYVANGIASADKAVAIARALNRTVDWLLTGDKPRSEHVRSAENSDWIEIPTYDLLNVTDESLGAPLTSVPVRKDWLNSTFHVSSGIWLARLLWDYPSAGLQEGTMVFCRSLGPQDLIDGHVCLWRVEERMVIGRFSAKPPSPPKMWSGAIADLPGVPLEAGAIGHLVDAILKGARNDLVVTPAQLNQYHVVGRVLGVYMRQI